MTYAEFVSRLTAAIVLDASTDDGWAAYLPAIIEQAELRCYRDVDFLAVRRTVTVALVAGAAQYGAPADWFIGQEIRLTTPHVPLDRRDESFVRELSGLLGEPKYWAEPTQGILLFAPIPDAAYTAELRYHYRPARLSPTSTSNWLSINAPDLMFYAAAVATAGYLKNFGAQSDDPRSALSWEQQYQTALLAVKREEGRRKGEIGFDSSPAPPPTSNLPPGVQG